MKKTTTFFSLSDCYQILLLCLNITQISNNRRRRHSHWKLKFIEFEIFTISLWITERKLRGRNFLWSKHFDGNNFLSIRHREFAVTDITFSHMSVSLEIFFLISKLRVFDYCFVFFISMTHTFYIRIKAIHDQERI